MNSAAEVQLLWLGIVVGVIMVLLWEDHHDAAMIILGFCLAMTIGQTLTPWTPSYKEFVDQRPLAAKPWYFLLPMTITVSMGVPLRRGLENWWDELEEEYLPTGGE